MITALDVHPALVLIDLQNRILQQPLAHPVADILDCAGHLVTAFRKAGLPVVLVNVNPTGPWLKARKAPAPLLGEMSDHDLALDSRLPTGPADIRITKPGWNAFFGTDLYAHLQALGVTNLVLGGVSTGIGVQGTARAASELGYNLTFAEDAMTDANAVSHEVAVGTIFPRIGEVGSTADITALLAARRA